jgi:Tol biopolymer transport system component
MRLGTVVARGTLLLVSIAVACSDDDDDGDPTCASGFVLKGGICVKPSDNLGGSGTTAGTTSTAGKDQGGAGDALTGGTGGADWGIGGDTALGGVGGDTNAGGMGGEGPVTPYLAPTRWLVFTHKNGVFAYDTTKFPESNALTALSDKEQVTTSRCLLWSPDGRTLLYLDVSDVYAVDLSGDTRSASRLLLSNPTAPSPQLNLARPWSWSADSSSVAVVSGTTLSVLDPTRAAPTLRPLTTKLKSYSWAPYGGRLLYADDTGSYVVQVAQGTPGATIAVDAGATVWSPNGAQLAGVKGGDLALTTLSDDTASLEMLTTVHEGVDPLPALDPGHIQFNKSGSKLTFSGQLAVDESFNGYTLALKPRGEPTAVPSDAPDDADTSCRSWSPDGKLLLCSYYNAAGSQWFAVDPVADDFTKILGVGSTGDWTWSPEPSRHQLFATSVDGTQQITMVDLAAPSTAVPIFVGFTPFSISPAGTLLTYLTKPTIQLVDLAAPQNTPVAIQTDQLASDPPAWGWSPNGQFIAIADGSNQQRLARIEGAAASTPVALGGSSSSTIYFAWQP